MKNRIFILIILIIIGNSIFSQELKPRDRWFIQPHIFSGYTFGNEKSGWGYGAGIRCLYDFERKFLGGPLFLGLETSYLSSLKFATFDGTKDRYDYSKQEYMVISPVLEQNYSWLKNGFHIATGFGYYKNLQTINKSAIGMITNIGWFPIYKGNVVTPYITYRNDWIFDKNGTNMQSICLLA